MNEQANKSKKGKRRWLRFSLSTFLLGVTVFGAWLGLLVHRVNKQKAAVREQGGTVYYDFELSEDNPFSVDEQGETPAPDWLCDLVGIDYFADAEFVRISAVVTDISPLANLRDLRALVLDAAPLPDLTPLEDLPHVHIYHSQYQVKVPKRLKGRVERLDK